VLARAFDRVHAMELVKLGVDYQIRELFESALSFGKETLMQLGASEEEAAELIEGARERDRMRFEAQLLSGDLQAARDFTLKNAEEQAREAGRTGGPSEPIVPAAGRPEPV
jgi:glutathione-regulated potassium-efflux system protein KefB